MSFSARPQRQDVRTAVLQAAGELFTRQGYAVTTVDQIASAAGFTKGAVYSNFGGKPELLAAAAADWFAGSAQHAIQAAALLGGDRSSELARQLADLVLNDGWFVLMTEFRVLAQRDPALANVYAGLRSRQQTELAQRLRHDSEGLALRADLDHDATAALLLSLVPALAMEHAIAPEVTTRAVIEAAMDQLLRGVRP